MSGEARSALERQQNRAAIRDAVPAVLALVVLEGIVAILHLDAGEHRWHIAIALLPMLAGIWLAVVQLRSLRRCDEYQRGVQLEAMSCGFAAAMLVAMAGGLLSGADVGHDAQYLQVTFIVGILAWLGALAIRTRR